MKEFTLPSWQGKPKRHKRKLLQAILHSKEYPVNTYHWIHLKILLSCPKIASEKNTPSLPRSLLLFVPDLLHAAASAAFCRLSNRSSHTFAMFRVAGTGSRRAEQMQSRLGNHPETWLRRVSTAASTLSSATCRASPPRGNKFAGRTDRRLPHQFHPVRWPQFQSGKRTSFIRRAGAYPRLSPATTTRPRQGKPICK